MIVLDAQQTASALPWPHLIEALRDGFAEGCEAPLRHHHQFEIPSEVSGTLLLMPAWTAGRYLGVKQVLVIPDNQQRNLSSVCASYQLSSALTGQPLAHIDGAVLTNRRTAAASALASSYLSRSDSSKLLMVGTGGLARSLIEAHCTARTITNVSVWGRNARHSRALAEDMQQIGINANSVDDLQSACGTADIISCATSSSDALIQGAWLSDGTHVDLVGAFTADMRESDDELISKASIFVDTRAGALTEAGDILQPLKDGLINEDDIVADLYDLTRETHAGRKSASEITVFKSVGTALEDLAAAVLAYQACTD